MNVKSNVIIFSTDYEERKDVRRLKEKKLQVLLDENNRFPIFEINNKEYIKDIVSEQVEKILTTPDFYIEQLYTWGDPQYYTNNELIVSYLVIVNKKNIKEMQDKYKFYDLHISDIANSNIQKVTLENEYIRVDYEIKTTTKRKRQNIEYIHKLVKKAEIDELTAIIIHTGIKRLRNRIENTNIAFSFLDKEFAISELQQIYEIILDKKLVSANFRKKIEPMVKKTNKVVKESAYRPSNQYTFNEDYIRNWV